MIKRPFLIAEIGINHNGDLSIAKKLIGRSKQAGFHAVKFQKRNIQEVYSKEELDKPRTSPWGTINREQKYGLEFEKNEYDEINLYCKKKGIEWFASAWDFKSLEFLNQYNLNFNKIASAMIVSTPFLEEVSKRKKYTFISTGMSSKEDINNAVKIFKKNNCEFELMHCVSTYPLPAEDVNLNTIIALKNEYNCKVGYSGHENGIAISIGAAVLGATSIERHITLDRTMYGSDQSASLEWRGMQELVENITKINIAMGKNQLGKIFDSEKEIAKKLRSHLKSEKYK